MSEFRPCVSHAPFMIASRDVPEVHGSGSHPRNGNDVEHINLKKILDVSFGHMRSHEIVFCDHKSEKNSFCAVTLCDKHVLK